MSELDKMSDREVDRRFRGYKDEHLAQGHDVFTKEALTHNPLDFIQSVCKAVGCAASVGN